MKKKRLTLAVVLALLGIAGGWCFLREPETPPNRTTYEEIQIGMTEAEVVALFPQGFVKTKPGPEYMPKLMARMGSQELVPSMPNGGYETKHIPDIGVDYVDQRTGVRLGKYRWWQNDRYILSVTYDAQNRVVNKELSKFVLSDQAHADESRLSFWIRALLE